MVYEDRNYGRTPERPRQPRVSNPARLGVRGFRCIKLDCVLVYQSTLNESCENCGSVNEQEKPSI